MRGRGGTRRERCACAPTRLRHPWRTRFADPKVAERGLRRIKYLYAGRPAASANQRWHDHPGAARDSSIRPSSISPWMFFADAVARARALGSTRAYTRFSSSVKLDYDKSRCRRSTPEKSRLNSRRLRRPFRATAGPSLARPTPRPAIRKSQACFFAVPDITSSAGELFWARTDDSFVPKSSPLTHQPCIAEGSRPHEARRTLTNPYRPDLLVPRRAGGPSGSCRRSSLLSNQSRK